mgnify:CR=1 FL=1
MAIKAREKPSSLINYMTRSDWHYSNFLRSSSAEYYWQRLLRKGRFSIFLDDENFWLYALNYRVARSYFHYAKEARGCQRIVEKTPRHLLFSNRIFKSFPRAQLLVMVRHPVDVYSSYEKRRRRQPDNDWLNIDLPTFFKEYRQYLNVIRQIADDQRVYILRYEDFVTKPVECFKGICKFLKEPYENGPISEGEPRLEGEDVDPNLIKKITIKTKDWSKFISRSDVKHLESELQDLMEEYDYDSKLSGSST